MFDVTHGAGLAALWPSWARYVCGNIPGRFARYAVNVMGVTPGATDAETAGEGHPGHGGLLPEIGMPTNLRELGINPTDEQLHAMAHSCASACGGSKGSARLLPRGGYVQHLQDGAVKSA